MPKLREYQFPAMSALQAYVNLFQTKMSNGFYYREVKATFTLRYWSDMADEDWEFFRQIGTVLSQDRERIGYPDAVIDLSIDRLNAFEVAGGNKHCAQICAAIAGVEAPPVPKVRARKPDGLMRRIVSVDSIPGITQISHEEFMTLPDESIGAVVGYRGWETYMAAAQGLAVVELVAPDFNVDWLSKWINPFYRAVETNDDMLVLLDAALINLKGILRWLYERDRALAARGTQTGRSMSSVHPVGSISGQVQ